MAEERSFEEIFDEHNFTYRAEKSVKEYSSWLLGISLGLGAVIISASNNFQECRFYTIVSMSVVFLNTLYSGYVKYLLMNRDIQMNVRFGELKRLKILRDAMRSNSTSLEEDVKRLDHWNTIFQEYYIESDKLMEIGKHLNWSTYFMAISALASGIYVLLSNLN